MWSFVLQKEKVGKGIDRRDARLQAELLVIIKRVIK